MKHTPLHAQHKRLGAKMIDFGGWDLPVQYTGIQQEHKAVRERAGLFDVSHMGEVRVRGPEAISYLNHVVTNDVAKLVDGQALYTVMCYENGGIVDDLIVYRIHEEEFFICINAGNAEKDFAWFEERKGSYQVMLKNESSEWAQIALQGPKAAAILEVLAGTVAQELTPFRFIQAKMLGTSAIIARTGYTGEDGFELYIPAADAEKVWCSLLEVGKPLGLEPCGLGARDTLRLEAGLALYGNDIDANTNPLEAGLGWVVKFSKGDFFGRAALEKIKLAGPVRKLTALRMQERLIPRHHYDVVDAHSERTIGTVTSGTLSPTLDIPIAMAYIESSYPGPTARVRVRDRLPVAEVGKLPFYRRQKKES